MVADGAGEWMLKAPRLVREQRKQMKVLMLEVLGAAVTFDRLLSTVL